MAYTLNPEEIVSWRRNLFFMRLSIEISFEQLLNYIRQLSFSEKEKLVLEIQKDMVFKKKEAAPTALQKLLLQGPTWSENDYQQVLKTREQINQVGKDDSA
ncbi:MAG: hypothetical protein SF052_14810 [Bacteroidia bacterium]|nr:hypothetical protein [Bacteroidia bacterium]